MRAPLAGGKLPGGLLPRCRLGGPCLFWWVDATSFSRFSFRLWMPLR